MKATTGKQKLVRNPENVWQPFGTFSMVAVQGEGRTVHLKGQVSLDRSGKIVGEGDMSAQVRQTLENIKAVLEDLGGTMTDIFSLTHYTTDIAAFMTCSPLRESYFSEPFPVTTTVEVGRLYDPRLMIEITAIAEIPSNRIKLEVNE